MHWGPFCGGAVRALWLQAAPEQDEATNKLEKKISGM